MYVLLVHSVTMSQKDLFLFLLFPGLGLVLLCGVGFTLSETCQLKWESKILKTEHGNCESDGEVTYTYCYGDCWNSSSLPVLNLNAKEPFVRNTCKCCTAVYRSMNRITVNCGKDKAIAYYPDIGFCTCQALQNRTISDVANEEQVAERNATHCATVLPIVPVTPLWNSDFILALCYCLLLGVALLIGTFGNVIIIFVTSTTGAMNKVGKQFIINLAVSDLCVAGIAEPMCIVAVIMGENWFSDKWLLCELTAALCTTACFCSFLSLTAATFNRYMYICQRQTYDKIFNEASTIITCLGCWILAFGFEFPNLIGWGDNAYDTKTHQCQWDRTADLSYTLFLTVFLIGGPLSLMSACHVLILRKIWRTKANIYAMDRDGKKGMATAWKPAFRACRTLLVIFLVFIICWVPYAVITGSDFSNEYAMETHLFATMLAHFHSSSTILVYMFTNKRFRRSVLKLFPCAIMIQWRRSFKTRSSDYGRTATAGITGRDINTKPDVTV